MEFPDAPLREWTQSARDGTRLFVRAADAAGEPRGLVLIVHGFGEHSARYIHVMRRLAAEGFTVAAPDLRGHGRSTGRRGDLPSYDAFFDDLEGIWNEFTATAPKLPAFLYGHSMGGQIVLNLATARRPHAAGLVVTSPWLKLAFNPAAGKTMLAWLAARIWPGFTQATGMRPERLSRDLAFLAGMPDLHLVHHRISARMYWFLRAGAARAQQASFTLPILLLHGSNDPVTSVGATEQLFARLQSSDKTLLLVPGALHETHNDLCREEVMGQVTSWLQHRCNLSPSSH